MGLWGGRRAGLAALAVAGLLLAGAAPSRGAAAAPLRYVALGDSFTSGPLVLPHDTTWVPEDCGQSRFNYPHLAAPEIGATSFVDMSCGGANIRDLYAPQTGLTMGGTNAAQLNAVTAATQVVTLGIAGNDVGFVSLALDCVRFVGPPQEQPCTPDYNQGGVDQISQKIAAVAPELGRAIRDIQTKAPTAQIFVISYPTALPDDGVACWPYLPILPEDMPYLVAKYKEMNAMLAAQAAANGATYVDIYTSSIGHDACQPPGLAWVNGMVLAPPSYPAHPNQLGLANAGTVVAAAINEQLSRRPVAPTPEDPPSGAGPSTPSNPRPAATTADPGGGAGTLPATGSAVPLGWGLLALATGTVALTRVRRIGR